jgi:hypothetical protein
MISLETVTQLDVEFRIDHAAFQIPKDTLTPAVVHVVLANLRDQLIVTLAACGLSGVSTGTGQGVSYGVILAFDVTSCHTQRLDCCDTGRPCHYNMPSDI